MTSRDASPHETLVDSWLERVARGLPADGLIDVFEQGFSALWRRAHRTLGDVTLGAITDRVLSDAAARHPILAPIERDTSGLHCRRLRERAELRPDLLVAGIRFVVVEFLAVLGNLTAEVLTPSLHAELSALGRERDKARAPAAAAVPPKPARTDGEEREP